MTEVREQGGGIPLMLLHGISSGAASWHKQMALNGFRVLAWDMPGYGESPMLAAERANAGDYADALAAMLDRAGVWQAVLVGHSLGALVASAFAAPRPAPRSCCVPARARRMSVASRRECANCARRATSLLHGCWRTTIFTAG